MNNIELKHTIKHIFIVAVVLIPPVICSTKYKSISEKYYKEIVELNATIHIQDSIIKDNKNIIDYYESINSKIDTLNIIKPYYNKIDSLNTILFIKDYKLERIKEYSNIVKRNPSQVKYLRGWIDRVLNN